MALPMVTLAFLLAFAFVLALLVWAQARRKIARSGIPDGRLVFQDADRRRTSKLVGLVKAFVLLDLLVIPPARLACNAFNSQALFLT